MTNQEAQQMPHTALAVVDPRDGTLLGDLHDESTDLLAHVAVELNARVQQLKAMRERVDAELTQRVHHAGRKIVLVDNLELRVESGRGRVWDGEELEAALRELVDGGVMQAGELTGILDRTPRVDGKQAARLLGLLHGQPLATVEACFRWEQKGRPRLVITPSVQLIPQETQS